MLKTQTLRTCEWFAAQLEVVRTELNYDLWAHVFMHDHIHLVVNPRQREYDTSVFLKRLKEPVSRRAVQFLKKEAPEWLERIRVKRALGLNITSGSPGGITIATENHSSSTSCDAVTKMGVRDAKRK